MITTQITISIVAISLTTAAMFGGYKYASAHSGGNGWQNGIMQQIHALSDDDWNDPVKLEKLQQTCVDRSEEKFTKFVARAADTLDIDDAQTPSWDILISTIHAEKATAQLVCEKLLIRANTENLPARLELMSSLLAVGEETLQRLTPVVTQVYVELNDEQKERVEYMISKHHRRFGMMHH